MYKKDTAIIVTYQAVNQGTGLTIKMDVYDEAHALDAQSVAAMTEVGATGRYYATFTPDADGEWMTVCYKDGGGGEVIKAFRVKDADEYGIKAAVDTRAPAAEYDAQLDQNLSDTESNIRGADSDTLKTLSDEIALLGGGAMCG